MKHRALADPEVLFDPWLVIGEVLVGDLPYKLYNGNVTTYNELQITLRDSDMLKQYRRLTGDNRTQVNWSASRDVVYGFITMEWYRARGEAVPAKVAARQEERMAKAKTASPEAPDEAKAKGAKGPRVTSKSIIHAGLLAGDDQDKILAAVRKQFPDRKTDEKHIAYYRHFLERDGKLEKKVKEPKAPKVKAEKTAAPASATVAAASKGKAKGKAGK